MYYSRRKRFSQNFLHSRGLVNKLIQGSSIGKKDLVLEIGPGKGIITEKLIKQAGKVLAVEIDPQWYQYLKNKFVNVHTLTVYQDDFLTYQLPNQPYKVFANVPFAIEGKIIRKLIDAKNPPEDCYMVIMKEVAYRLSAPYAENLFSISHKPWFDFTIYHHFHPTDFAPIPSVQAVMLRFTKRQSPLLPWSEKESYQQFIQAGFGQGQAVFKNLQHSFGRERVLLAYNHLSLNKGIKPSFLSLHQWLLLYQKIELV